ncbi:MAG: carbohydrate-binding family 9-like protein [Oscillospiraceae bacterium]
MQSYTIMRQQGKPRWDAVPGAQIDRFNWNCKYQPLSRAQLLLLDDRALAVRLLSYEENPVSKCECLDGPVYKDSCIEFFVNAFPEKSDCYLNFECNHTGHLFINYGGEIDWHQRKKTSALGLSHPSVECFSGSDPRGDYWGVSFEIPLSFFERVYGEKWSPHEMRGNFFKCGDDTPHPHFGSWTEITYPRPNFHLPEFFGKLVFED